MKTKTLAIIAALVFTIAAHAQVPAKTTIADTLYDQAGHLLNGTLSISNKTEFTSADGAVIAAGAVVKATVTNGAFSVQLVPNSGSSPSGTSYSVEYQVSGKYYTEFWLVPSSGTTVNLAAVRIASPPLPSIMLAMSQVGPPPNCIGKVPEWSGTQWTCVNPGGAPRRFFTNESPDGARTVFTIPAAPIDTLHFQMIWNGLTLAEADDYAISIGSSSTTITMARAPQANDHLVAIF